MFVPTLPKILDPLPETHLFFLFGLIAKTIVYSIILYPTFYVITHNVHAVCFGLNEAI